MEFKVIIIIKFCWWLAAIKDNLGNLTTFCFFSFKSFILELLNAQDILLKLEIEGRDENVSLTSTKKKSVVDVVDVDCRPS